MLHVAKYAEELKQLPHNQCMLSYHGMWKNTIVVGGVEHCAECGAILGSVTHLYKIWRRCVEELGLKPKGHEFGQ